MRNLTQITVGIEVKSYIVSYHAAEFSSKIEIFDQGGLEPIIKLMSSPDCDVQVLEVRRHWYSAVNCYYSWDQSFEQSVSNFG